LIPCCEAASLVWVMKEEFVGKKTLRLTIFVVKEIVMKSPFAQHNWWTCVLDLASHMVVVLWCQLSLVEIAPKGSTRTNDSREGVVEEGTGVNVSVPCFEDCHGFMASWLMANPNAMFALEPSFVGTKASLCSHVRSKNTFGGMFDALVLLLSRWWFVMWSQFCLRGSTMSPTAPNLAKNQFVLEGNDHPLFTAVQKEPLGADWCICALDFPHLGWEVKLISFGGWQEGPNGTKCGAKSVVLEGVCLFLEQPTGNHVKLILHWECQEWMQIQGCLQFHMHLKQTIAVL